MLKWTIAAAGLTSICLSTFVAYKAGQSSVQVEQATVNLETYKEILEQAGNETLDLSDDDAVLTELCTRFASFADNAECSALLSRQ